MTRSKVGRRIFLKAAGVSAAAMGAPGGLAAKTTESGGASPTPEGFAPPSDFPKLAIITPYSRQKLAFATSVGYEGAVVSLSKDFRPGLSDSAIDAINSTAHETGCRIISIECMFAHDGRPVNHVTADSSERQRAQNYFVQCIEFAHRLGCKFVGTFSGGTRGAKMDDQAKALAEAFNEKYLPGLEKYDMSTGWENYPTDINFATYPAAWHAVFSQVQSQRLGLEFDPSHLVRQYIDPYQAAWDFRERIRGVHAKDTEITLPILQQVGIHGEGWWRYRIPGQGLIDWARFITVLLQVKFNGGIAVEHEDPFWEGKPPSEDEFAQGRKDGFILAQRYLRQFLPTRPALKS
jgi:sugar phosphate isomerase/epimerase